MRAIANLENVILLEARPTVLVIGEAASLFDRECLNGLHVTRKRACAEHPRKLAFLNEECCSWIEVLKPVSRAGS